MAKQPPKPAAPVAQPPKAPPPPAQAPRAPGNVAQSVSALQSLPETQPKKRTRAGLSDEAIAKSSKRKRQNTLFSAYIAACIAAAIPREARGRTPERQAAVQLEVEQLRRDLEEGKQDRAVPLYSDETREALREGKTIQQRVRLKGPDGKALMGIERRPIKPHEVLRLRQRLRELEGGEVSAEVRTVDAQLRADFLAMLPEYAGYGYSVQDLLDAGVPEADLREVGLILTVSPPED